VYVPCLCDNALSWKDCRHYFPGPPPEWKRWLLDQGSLTEALVRHSGGRFRVEVVNESWWHGHSPYLVGLLGSGLAKQRMWSRRVVLRGDDVPWVLAHTLVPQASLFGELGQVKKLRNRPLGAFLFAHPGLRRARLHVSRFDTGWGRCSLFVLNRQPVLVAEFFLPALIQSSPLLPLVAK